MHLTRARLSPLRTLVVAVVATTIVLSSLMAWSPPASAAPSTDLGAQSLTTNGRVNPLGIPGASPTFGWALSSEARGTTQSAYEIQVGTAPGESDIWATGKVTSDKQVDVAYEGPALTSATKYFWRVRAWDGNGVASAWSDAATFETGLLAEKDWGTAQWIGKSAAYAGWDDYTAAVDFTLNSLAFGVFLRAADPSNAYMWQLNVGGSASSTPVLVPHRRVNGGYSQLATIDLAALGFSRQSLLAGTHRFTFEIAGTSIKTSLDGVVVDTRTVTDFPTGGVGIRTFGSESVTVRGLTVTKPDGSSLAAPSFSNGNPLTAGAYADGAVTVTGVTEAFLRTGDNNAPLLRTGFETAAGKTVAAARVYASAHGVYELSLNGQKVGDQELAPGYTEYAARIQSQTYDVTDLVRKGANGFGAALGDGWWAGKVGLAGKYQYGQNLALVARLKITYTDGSEQWVDSGPNWKWASGPYESTDLQIGESYDARFERPGWSNGDFDARSWSPVRPVASDTAKLSPQPDEPVRQTQVLDTVAVTTPRPGVTVYDVGQNMVGVPRVTITGKAGQTVKLRHAEVLNPDGTLYTENLRAALSTDYYTFAADGTVTYEPSFTQHGFRYIEITGADVAPPADAVKGVVWGSDLARTGTLQTSNALMNKLMSNVSWGARGNFLSIPTDTPARDERLGWTGDISLFAPSAAYMFDMRGFLGKWMQDVRDEQKPDGQIPAVVPSTNGAFGDSGPGWQEAIITVPYSLYRGYDDLAVVKKNWPNMVKFYDFAASRIGDDNLGAYGSTFFTNDDWLSLEDTRFASNDVKTTAIWADAVRMLAEMSAAIGDSRAKEFADRYTEIKKDFVAAYVSPDGTVAGGAQTVYALTLGMNLIDDPALKAKVGEKFVAKLALTDNHLSTGFIGTPYLLPALTAIGRDDLAYTMLLKETYPSWGYEIAKGATTVWERWNSIQPDGSFGPVDMNSFNHYAYGAVVDWMHQNVGGIKMDAAGYKTSIIEPRPGGSLTEASGELQTVYGKLSNAWKLVDGTLTLDVTVPVNTTSKVRIPSTSTWAVLEGGKPVASAAGVKKVERDAAAGVTVVTVGSGTYSFAATSAQQNLTAILTQLDEFATAAAGETLSAAVREHITAEVARASTFGQDALTRALAGDAPGSATALRDALRTVSSLRTWLSGSGVAEATAQKLSAQLAGIENAMQSALTSAAGIVVTVNPVSGPVAVGSAARATVVIKNTSAQAVEAVTGTVTVPGLTREPVTLSAPRIAAGGEATVNVEIPTTRTARAGSYDAAFAFALTTPGGELRYTAAAAGWVTLATDVAITGVVVRTTAPGTQSLEVSLTNHGAGPVSGRVEASVPTGWRSAPSALTRIEAGATTTISVPVFVPLDAAAGVSPVAVAFVDRGAKLAESTAQVTVGAVTTPPTEATSDYVDFGDTASETAHGVQGSPTSGTNTEAGLTRRYANNSTPGSWYSARIAVPAGQPFLLRTRETWNSAGTKDYDILINDKLVKHVNYARTAGGQGVTSQQFLVDDPAVLSHNGTVTVKFQYPQANAARQYYDPSIADLWVVSVPDTAAPSVSATPDARAVLSENGSYASAVSVTVNAADDFDPAPKIEYWADGKWTPYSGAVTFDRDGTNEFRYRAADRSGNVSAVSVLNLRIDRSQPARAVDFTVGAAVVRCVAGKATVTVPVTNSGGSALTATIASPIGSKSTGTVAAGKTVSHTLNSRTASIAAGEVTVTAKATVGGAELTTAKKVAYSAHTCR